MQECKKIFGSELLLTAAVAAGGKSVETSYEIAKIAKHLDFINVMTYDMRGVWDKQTGHHALLHGFPQDPPKLAKLNVVSACIALKERSAFSRSVKSFTYQCSLVFVI